MEDRRHLDDVLVERLDNFIAQNKLDHEELKITLGAIREQTMKTNGRVTNLEKWQTGIIYGVAVANTILLPLVMWLVFQHLQA
jgi:hypothetical protein